MSGPRVGRPEARHLLAVVLAGIAALAVAESPLRLNEVQLLGSHNSYKQAMDADRMAALRQIDPALADSLDYAHAPLAEQLDLGVRKLEIDVFYDPGGRLFPRARRGASESSFPVLHVQNLDDRSNCVDLLDCLAQLSAWSQAHPRHLPVFLSFNAKDDVIERPGFVRPLPFGEDAWAAFDAELRAGLGTRLISPAEVFAAERLIWPTLDDARGRFLAVLDEGGDKRRAYAGSGPAAERWRERAMFADLPEGSPGAAIMIVNDPQADFERIQRLVRAGYIVRTRADADTREARLGDTRRRDAAWASGAQLVSTDYYRPDPRFGTDYQVGVPGGGVARCDPLLVAERCNVNAAGP